MKQRAAEWPPERAAEVCGISVAEVVDLARLYGQMAKDGEPVAIRANYGVQRVRGGGMRRYPDTPPAPVSGAGKPAARSDFATLTTLLPYLWVYKWRVLLALLCLVGAKLANVGVPLVLKQLVDAMSITPAHPQAMLVLPLGILVAYGALRLSTTVFTELREFLFARVTQRAVRTIALKVFRHLHALSLRFHLNRQTGGMCL